MSRNAPNIRFNKEDGSKYPDWEEKKISNLSMKIGDGLHGTPKYVENSDYHFVNGNNIKNGKLVLYESDKRVSQEIAFKNDKRLNSESILITLNGTIGNVGLYENQKIMIGKSIGYIIPKEINHLFLMYVLSTKTVQIQFNKSVTGTTIKNLGLGEIRETKLEIPLLPEQEKIANFLSVIDSRIEVQSDKVGNLEEMKKGLMQKLFSQEIRFKREDGGEYPEWEEMKLGDISRIQNGYAFKSGNFTKSGIPIIRISNIPIDKNEIDLSECVYYEEIDNADNFIVRNGEFLIAMSGATTGKVGRYIGDKIAYLNQRVGAFRVSDTLVNEFLGQFLYTDLFRDKLKLSLVAGAQPNIGSNDILCIDIKLPTYNEQIKIATFLSTIDEKIELEKDILGVLTELKKGLLQQMFV